MISTSSYGPLAQALVRRLGSDSGFDLARLVTSVDYHPPAEADLALRLMPNVPDLIIDSELVRGIDRVGLFLNIRLDDSVADLGRTAIPQARTIAIEHTSLVPAMPVNVPTYRSSIIGEMLCRSLRLMGQEPRAHFWVHDTGRHMRLVEPGWPERDSGKADHVAGHVFASALASDACGVMFPLCDNAKRVLPRQNGRADQTSDIVQNVCGGWKDTFESFDIRPPVFDLDTTVPAMLGSGWPVLLEDARLALSEQPGAIHPRHSGTSLSYLERNILYYLSLLTRYQKVYSVMPHRQLALCESARIGATAALGRDAEDLQLRPYGDVLIDGELDSLRGLRFHSLDGYLSDGEALGMTRDAVRRALASRLLSSRPVTSIHLDTSCWYLQGRRPDSRRHVPSGLVGALLLEDELHVLLDRAVGSADFAPLIFWAAEAERFVTREGDALSPDVRGRITVAADQVSVWQ